MKKISDKDIDIADSFDNISTETPDPRIKEGLDRRIAEHPRRISPVTANRLLTYGVAFVFAMIILPVLMITGRMFPLDRTLEMTYDDASTPPAILDYLTLSARENTLNDPLLTDLSLVTISFNDVVQAEPSSTEIGYSDGDEIQDADLTSIADGQYSVEGIDGARSLTDWVYDDLMVYCRRTTNKLLSVLKFQSFEISFLLSDSEIVATGCKDKNDRAYVIALLNDALSEMIKNSVVDGDETEYIKETKNGDKLSYFVNSAKTKEGKWLTRLFVESEGREAYAEIITDTAYETLNLLGGEEVVKADKE